MKYARDKDGTIHKIVKTTKSGLDNMYKCRGKRNKFYFLRDNFIKVIRERFEEVLFPRDILIEKTPKGRVLVIKFTKESTNGTLIIHTTDGDCFDGKYVSDKFNVVTSESYKRQIQKK
jgi:hypothetical protein